MVNVLYLLTWLSFLFIIVDNHKPGIRIHLIYMADPDHYMADPDHYMADPDHYMADPDHYMADPDHYMAGPDHYMADPDNFDSETLENPMIYKMSKQEIDQQRF